MYHSEQCQSETLQSTEWTDSELLGFLSLSLL